MRLSSLIVQNRSLTWGARTYIMGVLNITPDSFSGDGLLAQSGSSLVGGEAGSDKFWEEARRRAFDLAVKFVQEGADILDVGGESTRPGAQAIGIDEEIERVAPIIEKLRAELDVLISIDTYKSQVAEAAIKAGAHMVNDIWGFRADPDMPGLVARYGVPVILMHNRSSPAHAEIRDRLGGRYINVPYENLLEDVKRELLESVLLAKSAGISDDHIILDPGIGFGKTVEQNLELIDRLGEIRELGYPVLLGASRKSFIGYTLDLPPDQRLEGTAAAVSVGITRQADIVRVHDVGFMARVARMTDAIVRH